MEFQLIFIGKTTEKFMQIGIEHYFHKLKHYIPAKIIVIPSSKMKEANRYKSEEGMLTLKQISREDFVVLLDEGGKQYGSVELSMQIQKWMNQSHKRILFITGGAYGVSESVKNRANLIWSFSQLTFTHQVIRLMLLEQLYRAMTIIKGESYHHE
jgi:23S rRNA (pseudouridine1915-N3)-methyltransferase